MIIKGPIGGRKWSFEELLQPISQSPHRNKIFKTIHSSGYFTNGVMLTRLFSKEMEQIEKVHYDLIVSDSEYKKTEPLDVLERAIPKYLRVEVNFAKYISGNDKLKLVRLKGGGIKLYLEEKSFNHFYHRVSQLMNGKPLENCTSWWFSRKNGPIVVLEEEGFFRGRLLGSIAQFQVSDDDIEFGKANMKRCQKGKCWYYRKVKVKSEEKV